jgi:hypothetical protein
MRMRIMVDINISRDAMNEAAERANQEQRSLIDVINTLLREYAKGRTWLNLPPGPDDGTGIRDRLRAAEEVCLLYGWTGACRDTDRDKALHELWSHWVDVSGVSMSPADHPEMSDERIAELARQRDATRASALARIRVQYPDLPRVLPGAEQGGSEDG